MTTSKVGRPLKFTVEQFEKVETEFFEWCTESDYIPDVEGLAVYLDTSRKVINDYESKDEFSSTIKRIKNKIAFFKKQSAMKGDIPAAVFCFDFKNNHEYKDKHEFEGEVNNTILLTDYSGTKKPDEEPIQE